MAITLRNTKGIALTHNELDGNFTDLDTRSCCLEASVTTTNVANWNSAYGWGDHSAAGYITTETDPVFNASAAKNITTTQISNWDTSYGWGNHASAGYICNLVEDQSPQLGQDLDVGGNSIVSTTNGPINIAPHGTGKIVLSGATQLGGSLDVNGQKITSLSNADIDIEPNGTGNVLLGNFKFDADQSVGAGQDNYVMTYDHSTGSISLEASSGGSSYTNNDVDTHLNTSSATGNQLLCWTGTDYAWATVTGGGGSGSGTDTLVEDIVDYTASGTVENRDIADGAYFTDRSNNIISAQITIPSGSTKNIVEFRGYFSSASQSTSAKFTFERQINSGSFVAVKTQIHDDLVGRGTDSIILDTHGANAGDTVTYRIKNASGDTRKLFYYSNTSSAYMTDSIFSVRAVGATAATGSGTLVEDVLDYNAASPGSGNNTLSVVQDAFVRNRANTADAKVEITIPAGSTKNRLHISISGAGNNLTLQRSVAGGAYTDVETFYADTTTDRDILDTHGASAGQTVAYKIKNLQSSAATIYYSNGTVNKDCIFSVRAVGATIGGGGGGGGNETFVDFAASGTDLTRTIAPGSYLKDRSGNDIEAQITISSGGTKNLVRFHGTIYTTLNTPTSLTFERSVNGGAYTTVKTMPGEGTSGSDSTIIDTHGASAGDTVKYKIKNSMTGSTNSTLYYAGNAAGNYPALVYESVFSVREIGVSASSGGGSGISSIVEDTTPQLGGPLQLNGNDIITGQNRIAFHDSGPVSFMDFTTTQFGQTNNFVLSSVKSINLFLDSNGGDTGQAFRIYNNINPDSSPTETDYIFKVQENGDVNVTGKILLTDGGASSNYAAFGNDQDLKIFHNGNHSIIRETGTGSLYLQSDDNVILSTDANTEIMLKGIANGAVELYHDNVKKFETTATGVTVTGTVNGHTIPAGTGTFALLSDITSTSNTISQLNTNITVTDTGTNGTITFDTDGTDRWQFTSAGHLLPVAHCAYDIGSASQQIRHIFISDNSIKFGDAELPMTVTDSRLHFNSAKLMVDVIDDATPQLGGDLDVSTFDIVSITNRNIDILPHGTGKVNIDGDGSAGGVSVSDGLIEVRTGTGSVGAIDFYCEVNNYHKVTLKAPAHSNYSGDVNFTLPASNGTSGQYLKTDGAGNTSWVTISAGDATLAGTQTFTGDKTFSGKVIGTITDNSATGSFDLNNGNNFKLTPTGATTIDFTNMTAGQSGNIYLDNSGGHTISKDSTIKMLASQLNTISNTGVYWLSYYCIDGTNVVLTASGKLT